MKTKAGCWRPQEQEDLKLKKQIIKLDTEDV